MPLTVTMFLEAVGCDIDGCVVSLGDTTGVSRDVCLGVTSGGSHDMRVADGAFRRVSSRVVGVSRDESTKYDML